MRISIQNILLITFLFNFGFGGEITADNILNNSKYWPSRVVVTEEYKNGAEVVSENSQGILIRLERKFDKLLAVIDFGAEGLEEIPVALTDLITSANAILKGETKKSSPNMLAMIGPPKMIQGNEDGSIQIPDLDTFVSYNGFLLIYFPKDESTTVANYLKENKEKLSVNNLHPVLIPTFEVSNGYWDEYFKVHGVKAYFFREFLRQPIIHSLHHYPPLDSIKMTVINPDGLILKEGKTLDGKLLGEIFPGGL